MSQRHLNQLNFTREYRCAGSLFALLLTLSACGGADTAKISNAAARTALVPDAPQAVASASYDTAQTVDVRLHLIPPKQLATSTQLTAIQSVRNRRLQYISPSNTLIIIGVTPLGGSTTTYGPTACTGPTACSINFTAQPGPTTLSFTLSDASTSNILSSFKTTAVIMPGTLNTLKFTANPVVSSVILQLASLSVNAGTAANIALTVNAEDVDGNTIVGTASYVDVSGNPVSLLLRTTNIQAGGHGTVSILGPQRITAPAQAAIYAHYDGNWLESSTISVASTSSAVTNLTGVMLMITPHTTQYNAVGAPFDITVGPDGNIWYTEYTGKQIGRITPTGTITTFSEGSTGSTNLAGITTGLDGNLWFAKRSPDQIGVITTAGTVIHQYPASGTPRELVLGRGGNIWVTSEGGSNVEQITPNGIITNFTTPLQAPTIGITLGPDNNIWYASNSGTDQAIGTITETGTTASYLSSTSVYPHYITAGPDNNLWYTSNGNGPGCIGTTTLAGTSAAFCAGITTSSGVNLGKIIVGPDGNLWFTNISNSLIDRITPAGVVSEYGSGITAGSQPYSLTVGPDGNLWFTEQSGNRIGKFVY